MRCKYRENIVFSANCFIKNHAQAGGFGVSTLQAKDLQKIILGKKVD